MSPGPRVASGGVTRAEVAGFFGYLIALGLGRFGFPPLIPVMIAQGDLTPATAGYVATANFVGYVLGAVAAEPLARRFGARVAITGAVAATVLSFVASAAPFGLANLMGWRFVAGVSGGVLMVVAAPTILAGIPVERRGRAGGRFFMGIGVGMLLSGGLLPLLSGTPAAWLWLLLGAMSLAAAIPVLVFLPTEDPLARAPGAGPGGAGGLFQPALLGLAVLYAAIAVAYIPHTVFWVDFLARALGAGLGPGGTAWMVFGVGVMLGPPVLGRLADRWGGAATLRLAAAGFIAALAVPLLTVNPWLLGASSMLAGGLAIGSVPLMASRSNALVAPDLRRRVWALMTLLFAIAQGVGAWGMAALVGRLGDYRILFGVALVTLLLALMAEMGLARRA